MIVLRRLLAVFLIPVAAVLTAAAGAGFHAERTLPEPEFWLGRLEAVDAYERVHSEVLPAALADFSEPGADGVEFDFTRFEADIVRVAREVVPPEWIEAQAAGALAELLPYLLGETESLTVTVPFRDRVEAAAEAVKRESRDPAVYLPLYDEGVEWGAQRVVRTTAGSEVRIDLTEDEAAGFVRRVAPAEWLQESITETVDGALPYVVGEADTFEVAIDLEDRVDELAKVVGEVLERADADDVIVDDVVMPAAARELPDRIEVVDGVGFTREQITEAVRDTLTPEWVAEVRERTVEGVADYVTGRSDALEVTIDLRGRKRQVVEALTPRVEADLEAEWDALPVCGVGTATGPDRRLPVCRPPILTYEGFVSSADLDASAALAAALEPLVPDTVVLDEARLREVSGPMANEILDDVRRWSLQGFTISPETILDNLDPEDEQRLDELREAGAFTLDEPDLGSDPEGGDLDGIAVARAAARLTWLEALLLVAVVGALGGRNWGSRLGWACAPLALGAAALLALGGPVYGAVGPVIWDAVLDEALMGAESALDRAAAVLLVDFAQSAAGAFAGGVARTGLALLVLAALGLGTAACLQARARSPSPPSPRPRRGPGGEGQMPSGGGPFSPSRERGAR